MYVFQPGLELVLRVAAETNEPRPLSREDDAVADPHELVLRGVVAQRRLQLDRLRDALRLDRRVAAASGCVSACSCLSSVKSSAPLISV